MPNYKFKREDITTKEEVEKIIETSEPWLKALVGALYLFGCRLNEALKLRAKDVWVEDNYLVLSIPLSKKRAKSKVYEEKHILRVHKSAPFVEEILNYVQSKSPDAVLFPFSRQWVWLKIKQKKHDISPHVFRHDRLTKLAMMGASEFVLVDWAGWADPRPAQHYVRRTGRMAALFADKIE